MAWTIHKPGQGYWVRVMTAVLAGVAVLAAAAWAWNQAKALPIPTPEHRLTVTSVEGSFQPGEPITLESAEADRPVGRAIVVEFSPTQVGGVVTIEGFEPRAGFRDPSGTREIRAEDGGTATVNQTIGVPLFPRQYLMAGIAAVVILAGTAVTYWLVGVKRAVVDFLIATDNEMKKVNWSSWRDVRNSTWVVIVASILIAAGLYAADIMFGYFFRFVGVLQN